MKTTTQIIAREGWRCVGISGFLVLFCLAISCNVGAFLAFIVLIIALVGHYNPERIPAESGDNLLFVPIDGVVERIETKDDCCVVVIDSPLWRVGVVRAPLKSRVVAITMIEGLRLVDDKLGKLLNASTTILFDSAFGTFNMKLSPKVFKRNIFTYPSVNSQLKECERIGFMRCGRLELVLPKNISLKVCEGDSVCGGESVLGILG